MPVGQTTRAEFQKNVTVSSPSGVSIWLSTPGRHSVLVFNPVSGDMTVNTGRIASAGAGANGLILIKDSSADAVPDKVTITSAIGFDAAFGYPVQSMAKNIQVGGIDATINRGDGKRHGGHAIFTGNVLLGGTGNNLRGCTI